MQAQLTDNSWLLYPEVRLTGGFAFVTWFGGPNAGEFVLTIGGYHPSFHRDGYPDVPRLGFQWRVSDASSIKGESYFALTSEALMAGGTARGRRATSGWPGPSLVLRRRRRSSTSTRSGSSVTAYARISAGITIDLWFGDDQHLDLARRAGHVWGPDFAGEATFEVGPCDLTDRVRRPDAAEAAADRLGRLRRQVPRGRRARDRPGPCPRSPAGARCRRRPAADRRPRPPTGRRALPFEVFAEFEMTITTSTPATAFVFGGDNHPMPITINGQGTALGLAPMQAHDLASPVAVSLFAIDSVTRAATPDGRLAKLVTGFNTRPDGPRSDTDSYPIGVWGAPGADVPTKPLPRATSSAPAS